MTSALWGRYLFDKFSVFEAALAGHPSAGLSCALLTDLITVKCWGTYVHIETIGDELNEMGDNLLAVNLGTLGQQVASLQVSIWQDDVVLIGLLKCLALIAGKVSFLSNRVRDVSHS